MDYAGIRSVVAAAALRMGSSTNTATRSGGGLDSDRRDSDLLLLLPEFCLAGRGGLLCFPDHSGCCPGCDDVDRWLEIS